MLRSTSRIAQRLAVAVLAVSAMVSSGAAAEIRTVEMPGGETVVELSGIVEAGDDARMRAAVANRPRPAAVRLSSLGGNVEAALAIGTLIRQERLRTVVPARTVCASACGLVWLAGSPRVMGVNAHVGLHAAYLRRNGVAVETGAANALIGAYLDRLGFDDHAIVYLTGAAPDEMTWILAADRQRYGIAFTSEEMPALAAAAPATPFLARPIALAGAIASAAIEAVDRIMGRPPSTANTTAP